MTLIYYPHPILRQKAQKVTHFQTQHLKNQITCLQQTLERYNALGLGANMCGLYDRIILAPLKDGAKAIIMINPEIIDQSDTYHRHEEASLCFPGISAIIERPDTVKMAYQDFQGAPHEVTLCGFCATIAQHERDYLDGVIFLDYLPKVTAQRLKEKTKKYIKKHFKMT